MPPSKGARAPRLPELQAWLRRVWTTPDGIDAALALPEGEAALSWIVDAPPVSARDRLAVYSDAYFFRLLESLGQDFPAAERALGEDGFRRLIADYLVQEGSDSYNISDLGSRLPDFVLTHEFQRRRPYLYELCRLEWAVLSALLTDRLPAPDPAVFAALSRRDWALARVRLDPTLSLLDCDWPVDELWRERAKPALPAPPKAPRKTSLAVWRDGDWANVEALGERAWLTLRRLRDGLTLERACALADASAAELQAWFGSWAAQGLVKGVERG